MHVMKTNFRHRLVAFGLYAAITGASRADAPPAPSGATPSMAAAASAPTMGDSARATAVSPWRDRGVLSTDDVIALLGITVTAEQRAQIDKATAQRNMALQAANAQFSTAIFDTLKTDDAELTKSMADEKERQRMELMRQRQPSRYQALKAKNKKN